MSTNSMNEKEILEGLAGYGDVKVDAKALLGTVKMPVGNFLKLTRGSIVSLEKPKDADIDILINERKVAEGQIKVSDEEKIHIEVTRVIKPKKY
jgi:flagellar motor switch protein FliN/FliY